MSALAVGTATVVATFSGLSDSVSVIVTDGLQLTVEPNAATVAVARTQRFTVVGRNSNGQIVAAPAVTWTSSNPAIATVSSSGVATGVAAGTTSITAKEESKALPTNSAMASTMKGDGAMVALPGGSRPKMTLVVDVQTCTHQVDANATLNALRTQPDGSTSRSDVLVAALHAKGGRPLGSLSRVAPDDGKFDGHSQTWSGLNPDQDAFTPVGLAAELMPQSRTEPAVGRAVVSWVLLPR